jgi:hypothetical protein
MFLLKKAGPFINHYEAECFSNHLTTFAGGFIVLPSPINWSYVFVNADFMRNKIVYLFNILHHFNDFCSIERQKLEKLEVTPSPNNQKSHRYFYQILVFTGQQVNQ